MSQVSQRIEELKEKFEHMKQRRGKHLRRFERDSAGGEFKGVTLTLNPAGRREDPLEEMPFAIARDINDLLNDTIFFREERFVKYSGGEPHSSFNAFNFKLWPDRKAGEGFSLYGEDQFDSLVTLFAPLLSEEEIENGLDQ